MNAKKRFIIFVLFVNFCSIECHFNFEILQNTVSTIENKVKNIIAPNYVEQYYQRKNNQSVVNDTVQNDFLSNVILQKENMYIITGFCIIVSVLYGVKNIFKQQKMTFEDIVQDSLFDLHHKNNDQRKDIFLQELRRNGYNSPYYQRKSDKILTELGL